MSAKKIVITHQKVSPVTRAQITLANLSSSGKLTEEQAGNFLAIMTCPYPPSKPRPWQLWRFPVYLYRLLRFRRINKRWEKEHGRKNLMLNMCILKNRDNP